MERLFIVFAATFLHSGDCQAKIKLMGGGGWGEGGDAYDPREVQIISLKNVPHGFSKFSSPNLISEAVLFINYLSVSVLYLIFLSHH